MSNRLANETSPYLLQHANNPVDWYPWGEVALAKARAEDKPILLSIGYSACHWCHVMEHESFEDEQIAGLMNQLFVNIKVDREERPDLDSIYMSAVQALTGRGGWPMTMFLTPDGAPFYGGTYFPPQDRGHMPGFPRVLRSVAEAYRTRRAEVGKSAEQLTAMLGRQVAPQASQYLAPELLDQALRALLPQFDMQEGGLGGAPKFPQPMALEFLLRSYRRTGSPEALAAAQLTLDKMACGGIYDQLGGGFHRYSVDAVWLVPHFEKMLYDNAQLARVYLQAYQVTGEPLFRRVVEETLEYVRCEMTDPGGGFYSTQDADSEGEEGKFFVWTPQEIEAVLGGEDARLLCAYFDVTEQGNFEHHTILRVAASVEAVALTLGVDPAGAQAVIERGRRGLFEARERRVKPGRDEKVLTAWNGLMLRTFAEAAAALDRDDYREQANRNAEFVLANLRRDGRLLRTWKDGQAKLNGYLEDYACLADGLLSLYEATFDPRWLAEARSIADVMIEQFADDSAGGFYDTGKDHERLVSRPKDLFDNATPSGNSVAAEALLRLGLLSGQGLYREAAERVLRLLGVIAAQHPAAFGRLLCALDFYLGSPKEIAIVGQPDAADTASLTRTVFSRYAPNKVVAGCAPNAAPPDIPLLADRPARNGKATAYVCQNYVCQAPATTPEELARQLEG
ncbi:MAG TPA: thioredoxin domain-containing protein [Chloroflexota bacterium]|nr:thioredoxin domain-containing protein [Chloroflexota bacterium]